MRPVSSSPLVIRGISLGGVKPLFCIPLVAKDREELLIQAHVARRLEADIVEWRVDSFNELAGESLVEEAQRLRSVLDREPIIFTLRSIAEGGAKQVSQDIRTRCIDAVLRSGHIDIVDLELSNGPQFLEPLIQTARRHAKPVILSFHDFEATQSNEVLLGKISAMIHQGADIAKIACMPRDPNDVLRLLQMTLTARRQFPAVPLCTIAMGSLGVLSRVAGFLYGSDMTFAVGQESSAPGQIPIAEARAISAAFLR